MREEKLWRFLALLSLATGARACIGSAPRSFSAPTVQFQQAPAPPAAVQVAPQPVQFVPAAGAAARVAAAPVPQGPGVASAGQTSVFEHLLGRSVRLSEFSVDGFNNAGGGPVKEAVALSCNFDGQPCCWANVAQPADQLDWSIATGRPETPAFQNVESPDGSYLIAYARAAAPSDEAQFASCAIGCSSSVIKVRARHWQSENVLLQVCQRESFPTSESNNPLLNCQEFPLQQGIATTEVELPKASVVDIVFVASNFIGQDGDLAIIDDIQVIYEHDPRECPADIEQGQIVQETESPDETTSSILEGGEEDGLENAAVSSSGSSAASGSSSGSLASSGSESSFSHKSETEETEETLIESSHGAKQHGSKISATSSSACIAAKCTFEDGTACSYNDAYTTESITGVNTKFEVVTGQFKNKVTGVKESSEGNFYAATFLHPREMAGLEASTGGLDGDRRLRFQYYEGTYGVLLKACCDSTDTCPFSSDRFVSVGDRTWKYATFLCPKGTDKIIFLCENTRTNQGACAIDDIQVIANSGTADSADEPLC